MNARTAALRPSEPKTLAEMQARKREADQRQAEAARRLERQSSADRARVQSFLREAEPPPAAAAVPEVEVAPAAPVPAPETIEAAPAIDPAVDAQIRTTLGGDRIDRTPRRIITRIAGEYGCRYEDIVGEGRDGHLIRAREAALAAVKAAHPTRSLPWLGRQFGNRDHTTILHMLRKLGLVAPPAANPILSGLTTDAQGRRAITPLALPDIKPAALPGPAPTLRLVDPRTLRVDTLYQRGLSEPSLALIRRIVEEWSWRAFKPPIVVEGDGGLDVIDGQHTAIGAATHPDIAEIPVLVVVAERREDRADAFVRHNRDRVRVTGMQMHVSLVAAGDPTAVGVEAACRAAGARVLRTNPSAKHYAVGDTMAVEMLGRLVRRHGVEKATAVVRACVEGELAPVTAAALRAVELLLHAPEHEGRYTPEALALCFRAMGPKVERDASIWAATHKVAQWQGLAAVLAKNTKRPRQSTGSDA